MTYLDLRTPEEKREEELQKKLWPKGVWINDGHRAEVTNFFDEHPLVSLDFIHPQECPHTLHKWGYKQYECPLYYENDAVGLCHPGSEYQHADNWDQEISEEDYWRFFKARDNMEIAVEYWYASGFDRWTGEYDWEFLWRPVELARLCDVAR